ncbi:helix-turn-helix domain-containing protein [Phytohabitans kaempferiae]|uniref:Helix-turn-helix domain-containing protein n=1 Tax=Phytohabitans kaempferiae TaxID=1620943 RepID=A0ABV6LXQ7_9ACTN
MPTKREHFHYSVRAQFLGERMRMMREDRGLTLKYIASYLGVEFSTLARYERAEWPFRADHVAALLDVYGVFEEREREELVALARNAWRVCHWQVAGVKDVGSAGINELPVIDPWWIQSRAEEVCVYAPVLVPPLVQSRDYAEALLRFTDPHLPVTMADQKVRRLLERQMVLDAKPPVRLTVILDESMLSRRLGGAAVSVAQWEHLTRVVESRPHVMILVLPTVAAMHAGMEGGFTVCRMRAPFPPVALLDQLTGNAVLEAEAAHRYDTAFDKLKDAALSRSESMALIKAAIEEQGGRSERAVAGREAVAA